MDTHKLVKMANEIAAFFEADPDHKTAVDGIAGHLKRFWDPRMRRELLAHFEAGGARLVACCSRASSTEGRSPSPPADTVR